MKHLTIVFILIFSFQYSNGQYVTTCKPKESQYWTGRVDWYQKIDEGIVVGKATANAHRGWIKFDLSSIPDNAEITQVDLRFYVDVASEEPATYSMKFSVLGFDPVTASRSSLWGDIISNSFLSCGSCGEAIGYRSITNITTLNSEVESRLSKDWIAIGLYEDNEDSDNCHIHGYSGYEPQLTVHYDYEEPISNDIFITNGLVVAETPLYPGNEIYVSCNQNYQGNSASTIYSNVGYYLSNDNVCSPSSDVLLGEDRSSLSISNTDDPEDDDPIIPLNTAPGDHYICIVGDHDNQIEETNELNNALISKITIAADATEVANLTPPHYSAEKEHNEVEIASIWGRRFGSVPSEYDASTGKIHHRSLVGANIVGGTNFYVLDRITIPFTVEKTGYYRITFKGKVNGSILAGRVAEIGHCAHYLAVTAGVYGIGAVKDELRNSLDEEWPSSLDYITEEAAKEIVKALFPSIWVTAGFTIYETIQKIDDLKEQLQQLRFYSNEEIGDNGLVVSGYLTEGTHEAVFMVNSNNIAGVSAGVVTSIIDVTAQLDNLIIEELGGQEEQIPITPELLIPLNLETDMSTSPSFSWNTIENAESYRLQVALDAGFSNLVVNIGNIKDSYYTISGLQNNETYYWRVNASNDAGNSSYSSIRSFTTLQNIPVTPNPLSPPNGDLDVENPVVISWENVDEATTYSLEISKFSDFQSIEYSDQTITSTSKSFVNLESKEKYYWRIKANNASGSSSWSAPPWNFTTAGVAPLAEFSTNTITGCAPLSVSFVDESTDGSEWLWDFGDGNTSSERNPTHIYQNEGIYTVKLTVSNNYGTDEEIKNEYIHVNPSMPVAEFSSFTQEGCAPLSVSFTDESTGSDNWLWDFGDGDSSSESNPTHVYQVSGEYTVKLMVENDCGSDEEMKSKLILVKPSLPTVDFSASTQEGCTPLSVSFTDESTGSDNWLWDFGDGNTSSERNPTHEYQNMGTYTIKLTVENDCGDVFEEKQDFIEVNCVTGLETFTKSGLIKIYPNPSNGEVHIETDIELDRLVVYDLYGRGVYSSEFRNTIYLGNLEDGIYILKLFNNDMLLKIERIVKFN